jgi:hypothetical protein
MHEPSLYYLIRTPADGESPPAIIAQGHLERLIEAAFEKALEDDANTDCWLEIVVRRVPRMRYQR